MKGRSQYPVVLSARIGSAGLTALSLALVGRYAGPEQFGWFAAILAVVSVVTVLSDLGYQTLAIRLYARVDERPSALAIMGRQRRFTLVVTGIQSVSLIALAAIGYVPMWAPLLAIWQWFEKEVRGSLGLALADRRVYVQLVALISNRTGSLLGFLVLLQVASAVTAFATSSAVIAGVTWIFLLRRTPKYAAASDWRLGALQRRQARHFWIASLSAQVRTLDVTLISLAASPMQAGLYSLPSRVSGPLKIAAASLSAVALPVASRGEVRELAELRRTMGWVTAFSWMGLGIIAVFAEPLVLLAVGPEFVGSVAPLRILLIGLALNIPGSFVSGVLQGSGHERLIARLGMVLAAVTVVLVPIGAQVSGAVGAAVSISIVYVIQFGAVVALSRRIKGSER